MQSIHPGQMLVTYSASSSDNVVLEGRLTHAGGRVRLFAYIWHCTGVPAHTPSSQPLTDR